MGKTVEIIALLSLTSSTMRQWKAAQPPLPAPHGMGPDGTDAARMASLEALLAAGAAPLRPFWRPF